MIKKVTDSDNNSDSINEIGSTYLGHNGSVVH